MTTRFSVSTSDADIARYLVTLADWMDDDNNGDSTDADVKSLIHSLLDNLHAYLRADWSADPLGNIWIARWESADSWQGLSNKMRACSILIDAMLDRLGGTGRARQHVGPRHPRTIEEALDPPDPAHLSD